MYTPKARQALRRTVPLVALVATAAVYSLHLTGSIDWLENRTSDWRSRWAVNPAAADKSIVIIDIDNASFRALTDKLGRWPWTRAVWTEVVRYIAPAKPRLIYLDILFSGSEPAADPEFADIIRQAGNVLLPFNFERGAMETPDRDILTPPEQARIRIEGPLRKLPTDDWFLNKPNTALRSVMAATGSVLWNPDEDGITRRLPVAIRYGDAAWSSMWLTAAQRLKQAQGGKVEGGWFESGPLRFPVNGRGEFVVRWYGDTLKSYQRIPLWELICSIYPTNCEAGVKTHPASFFHDKIVFLGASAGGSYDARPTPVSETAPGVFILATALNNVMHNDVVRTMPEWAVFLIIVVSGVLPVWPLLAFRDATLPLAITILGAILAVGICFAAYSRGLWIPMSAPFLATFTSYTAITVYRYFTIDRELSRTRGTLERYVSPQLVGYVMDHLDDFRFDGQKKKLTVFFSDVRGFTTLTEKTDPVELLKQLNEYLENMTDIIFRYNGIVDKFIGDGIMAHWGAFTPDQPNAFLAAKASLEMMARLHELNTQWTAQGMPALNIGIGLNTGDVIFGNVGTGKKVDFTAIGDGVNLAARLEGANKDYSTNIIISEFTLKELGNQAVTRPLGSIVVKGKTVGVNIFELVELRGSDS